MKRSIIICLVAVAIIVCGLTAPQESLAVPSFAKQTGRPCSGCHTVWPRLNATGREFKLQGYTEVADDYPRIQQDNLDLLRYGPAISLGLSSFLYSKDQFSDQKNTTMAETSVPDEAAFYFAGRMTPNIGTFTEFHWERATKTFGLELVKISAATRVGSSTTLGVVVGKMDVAGADPYNTIRYTAFHTVNTPAVFTQIRGMSGAYQPDFFSFSDPENMGIVVNGKFFQTLYAAAGAFRGDGGAYHTESDPIDRFYRLAYEYPLGESIVSLGGFYYDGKERYDHVDAFPALDNVYLTRVKRQGLDLQWQTESTPNLVDIVAVYMQGKDTNVDKIPGLAFSGPPEVKFTSWYAEASYFYERMYGITLGYDYFKSDEDPTLDKKGPTINVTYSPWLNTKLALEYSSFKHAGNVNEAVTSLFTQIVF